MKRRIEQYVDDLFADIYETKQLGELKEEIRGNLLEQVNDLMAKGDNANAAFEKAVSNLGDMSELVESLKKASETRFNEAMFKPVPLDKQHVIAYLIASVCVLLGLMLGGAAYLQYQDLFKTFIYLIPFILVAAPIFIYFGLTQETSHDYGMKSKRALSYSVAAEIFLLGATVSGVKYFQEQSLLHIVLIFMPFLVVSAAMFIYLGLTEKSRTKMDSEWAKQWVSYYSDPQSVLVSGSISGALWIFSFGAFIFLGFAWSWKFSWIVFVLAVVCQLLIEAYFAAKRNKRYS
ncbi:permease prefix domain 1-containing protein [Paenibacillus sp. YSY-4.3]